MTRLIPSNRRSNSLARVTGFGDFYNMLDGFFYDSRQPDRNFARDTFKIDIAENDTEYRIEAELPGIKKENIDLDIKDDNLCISINHEEEVEKDGKNYIHKERRAYAMKRTVRLANSKLDEITAKLESGVLTVTVPKDLNASISQKIEIE